MGLLVVHWSSEPSSSYSASKEEFNIAYEAIDEKFCMQMDIQEPLLNVFLKPFVSFLILK
jgi:hypothetical protein